MRWLEKFLKHDTIAPEAVQFSSISRILIIRQHDQLGDFLLAIPALRALRQSFPHSRITVLVREYFYDAAKFVPYVDEVLVFHEDGTRWKWRKLRAFWRKLRSGWDLTIVLNTVSHSLTSDMLAFFSKARYILGTSGRVFPGCQKNFFYNIRAQIDATPKHQSESNLDIVRYIGIDTDDLSEFIVVPTVERTSALHELHRKGLKNNSLIVGIHLGAGKELNRWPVANFRSLAERLNKEYNAQLVLFWGPAERALSDEFCDGLQFPFINIGFVDLGRLAAFFSQCHIFISNDTGTLHLAAAVQIPVIALYGPTDPSEWKPVSDRVVAVCSTSKNIKDINVEHVIIQLEELLARFKISTTRQEIDIFHHIPSLGKVV